MIQKNFDFSSANFRFYEEGNLVQDLDHPFWLINSGAKFEIEFLIENEVIKEHDSTYTIPIDIIFDSLESIDTPDGSEETSNLLSKDLLNFLEIPHIAPGNLEIESRKAFRSPNFQIHAWYRSGDQRIQITSSPLIYLNSGEEYLLQREQCTACRLISEHFKTDTRNQEDNFKLGAKLKKLSSIGNIDIVGGRLVKEEIEDVESIRPKFLRTKDGGIRLSFDLESGNNEEFEYLVNASHSLQDIFTVKGVGTQRKRYVLSDESKKAVKSYRKKSHFSREEKELLLDEPELFLDGFNLDDYSERVVGFGILYAPKISVFKDDEGIEWINVDITPITPEVEDIEDQPESVTSFKIDKDKAEEIHTLISEAKERGESTIIIDDQEIIITDELIKTVDKKIGKIKPIGLITRSNIDETTFDEGSPHSIIPPYPFQLPVPETFSKEYKLKDFQSQGYGWLEWLFNNTVDGNKFSGGLLADDMGMGKTIQICAFIALLKQQGLLKPSLLILPPILINEWEKELKKIVPSVSFYQIRSHVNKADIDTIKSKDIVAISYQALLKSQKILGTIEFNLIVCDEVQFIKNPAAFRTQAVLAMKGKFKIASTATPIENSISELWSILDYSTPGYLPPLREFNKEYGERKVSDEEFATKIEKLKKELLPIVLRRTKEEYLKDELPEKTTKTIPCEIDQKQLLLCRNIIDDFQSRTSISNFLHFFQVMVVALNNPELLNGQFGVVFPSDYTSPKLEKAIELLKGVKERNEKALIFADRKHIQAKLRNAIKENLGISPNIINSDTPTSIRDIYTNPFRPDGDVTECFDVLILSPRCAGFGLNLVQANNVIHYTRSFNPAVENQSTDRVYRIGQNKPVKVLNLVASTEDATLGYTVEQKLDELLNRKKDLLKDYLLASRAGRITEEDLASGMGYANPGLSISDVDKLDPLEFEAFVAELFSKKGYQTSLTPSQDFGADCIALGSATTPNALIQCKKKTIGSKGKIANRAIQEVLGAKGLYEDQKQVSFDLLIVVTNGYFTDQAKIQAYNQVQLIDRKKLAKELDNITITHSDLQNRMKEFENLF